LQFEREELEFIENAAIRMARLLELSNLELINDRTGNPYITLKLLAVYRRLRTLADYQDKGKIEFPNK
jgi:hypothetical protein